MTEREFISDLTTIVLTRDAADSLPGCLASIEQLGCPVLVLDSGSRDGTREIARSGGASVSMRAFDGFANQRNAALRMVNTPWALFVDADERVTPRLTCALLDAIEHADDDVAAFQIPRMNFAFGRVLRGGGWWPDYQVRLLRRGRAAYDDRQQVHEVVKLDGVAPVLTEVLVHLNYRDRRQFLRKQRAYTDLRIAHAPSDDVPRARHIGGAAVRQFWRRFIGDDGYRDGLDGLFMASVMAIEEARYVWSQWKRAGR